MIISTQFSKRVFPTSVLKKLYLIQARVFGEIINTIISDISLETLMHVFIFFKQFQFKNPPDS